MNFKDYRPRQAIRAAEITEESLNAIPVRFADTTDDLTEVVKQAEPFKKGAYVENRDGILVGYTKEDFEARFAAVRAERQSKTRKPRKAKAAETSG